MITKIYGYQDSTGRIAQYKEHLTFSDNGCALELEVEIPDWLNPYESVCGDICIEIEGSGYPISRLLVHNGDNHMLTLALPTLHGGYIALKPISEKWVDAARHI